MLPDESKYLPSLAKQLGNQFVFSTATLKEGVDLTLRPMSFRKQFHPTVQHAAVGLHVLTCRRFRQAIELCKIGQANGAESVCRSMFEGFLAQAFICRNSVSLRRRGSGKKIDTFSKRLTQEFRADLYFAHYYVQEMKALGNMARVPGLKRFAARRTKEIKREYDLWCNSVGPDWTNQLRRNTCGGLSIEDFSYSLGANHYQWYRTLYAIQSGFAHGGKFDISLRFTSGSSMPGLIWSDSPQDVHRALLTANHVFGIQQTEFKRLLDKTDKSYIKAGVFRDSSRAHFITSESR